MRTISIEVEGTKAAFVAASSKKNECVQSRSRDNAAEHMERPYDSVPAHLLKTQSEGDVFKAVRIGREYVQSAPVAMDASFNNDVDTNTPHSMPYPRET